MKKHYVILSITFLILFISCSEEKKNLKIESLSAFAYFVEEDWELNATAVVSGFQSQEENYKSVELSYSLDFISPSGKFIEDVDHGSIKKTMEADNDNAEIDVQLKISSEFETGDYKLIFNVLDKLSSSETSDTTNFALEGM